MTMPRVMVYSNQDAPLFELDPSQVHELRMVEELNGEHSLTVTTTARLEKMQRLIFKDGTLKWREFVVTGIDEEHQGGRRLFGTYYAVWSLQHDLSGTYVTGFPGYDDEEGVSSTVALGMALEGTGRWGVGDVSQDTYGKASFYYLSGWKALSALVAEWGGEVDAVISVDGGGVVSRSVNLSSHLGSQEAVRRFDYGIDLAGIRRKVADDRVTPRILPLGKAGVNGVRLDIKEVNGGVAWLQDDEVASYYRVPGAGGWEYPIQVIVNDECEWPEQLMEWAEEVKHDYTRPKVTYEASVVQLAAAGMDTHGIALGDESQVVDRAFGGDGLRVSGRVVKLETDLLEPSNTGVTLGHITEGLSGVLGEISTSISAMKSSIGFLSTAEYLDNLLKRLNDEINATGGWAYIVPGEGLVCYDKEVADPLIGIGVDGLPANQVVQMKGGSIRIANTRKAQFSGINDWNWRTVFRSGLIATDVLTATNIVTGIIEDGAHKTDPSTGNFWNLDTGELRMAAGSAKVGSQTLANYVSSAASSASSAVNNALTQAEILRRLTGGYTTEGLYISNGHLYINGSAIRTGALDADLITTGTLNADLITSGKIQSKNGRVYFDLDNNEMRCDNMISTDTRYTTTIASIDRIAVGSNSYVNGMLVYKSGYASSGIKIVPDSGIWANHAIKFFQGSYPTDYNGCVSVSSTSAGLYYGTGVSLSDGGDIVVSSSGFSLEGNSGSMSTNNGTTVYGGLTVYGSKSRAAETDDYGDRLLYCYETPTPMFGDIGSGIIGEDGLCYVEIGDVFSEAVDTWRSYQVFLQKRGRGDLWVAEKSTAYFVVAGAPGLEFDWELKAMQTGYAHLRLEQVGAQLSDLEDAARLESPERAYGEDDFVAQMEELYDTEIQEAA